MYRQLITALIVVFLLGVTASILVTVNSPRTFSIEDNHDDMDPALSHLDTSAQLGAAGAISSDLGETGTSSSSTSPVFGHKNKQFVVFAFDGSRSLKMWKDTRAYAAEMASSGMPVHYTYFINGVYLLAPKDHHLYQAPGMPAGVSNIGFGDSKQDVLDRIDQINGAIAEGHEIGSHNMGHFTGTKWTYDEWKDQLDNFKKTIYGASNFDPDYHLNLKEGDIIGFRAPNLGLNNAMFKALYDEGYLYDTSAISSGGKWPVKNAFGILEMPISTLRMGAHRSYVIAMDYSIFVHQTAAKDRVKKGTQEWAALYKDTYDAYKAQFDANYAGNHAPLYMANHFSTWNDGVYWEVMKDFGREVCGKPDVVCGSYKDLALYMKNVGK